MNKTQTAFLPEKIISGGQSGVDRAGLDAAIALNIPHGGWCPRGRMAEDGRIPKRYQLTESTAFAYPVRTEQNVRDSDATILILSGALTGGTKLTRGKCLQVGRPFLNFDLHSDTPQVIRDFLLETKPRVLNIAGPRESSRPGIYNKALRLLLAALDTQPATDDYCVPE